MSKIKTKDLLLLIFLLISTVLGLILLLQRQVFKKQAEEIAPKVVFSAAAENKLKRIWPNFAQGGEKKEPMINPASAQIKMLSPEYIRIDHIFDFPNLDQRIEEILKTGASPFLSLSYFPPEMSSEMTKIPDSLSGWQTLVEKTVQKYSGKNEKNLLGVYYEVFNEPDLFGKMTPQDYFRVYQASVNGAIKCQNCNPFKIGGPAITTLKSDWMDNFLNAVKQNQTRIDFISWHSYQLDPAKTAAEAGTLKRLPGYIGLPSKTELIISEFGSTPETSPLHDSYFDAVHMVNSVSVLKNTVDKIISFELIDGLDPAGNKYWGRWGLLTNEAKGISQKPRYFSFIYLNKLLDYELAQREISPNTAAVGSTDGKEAFTVIASRKSGSDQAVLNLKLMDFPPGIYSSNIYKLAPQSNPLVPDSSQITFNGGEFDMNMQSQSNSTFLIELNRTSAAIIKTSGRSGGQNDFAAKITSFVPPLVFPLNLREELNNGEISFWFKPNWGENDNINETLLETKDNNGSGVSLWIEKNGTNITLNLGIINQDKITQSSPIPISWAMNSWHQIVLNFDNNRLIAGLKADSEQKLLGLSSSHPLTIGKLLFLGSNASSKNQAEGAIDDLQIIINNELYYQKTFD